MLANKNNIQLTMVQIATHPREELSVKSQTSIVFKSNPGLLKARLLNPLQPKRPTKGEAQSTFACSTSSQCRWNVSSIFGFSSLRARTAWNALRQFRVGRAESSHSGYRWEWRPNPPAAACHWMQTSKSCLWGIAEAVRIFKRRPLHNPLT